MNDTVLFLITIFIIGGFFRFVWARGRKRDEYRPKKSFDHLILKTDSTEFQQKLPYQKTDRLLTKTEEKFFETLNKVANKINLLLFAKVRMEDLIRVPQYTNNQWGWRNRIKSRHTDFVLCDPQTTRPLLGIELDDYTHSYSSRKERDHMVNQIFNDAGLPLLHIHVNHQYDPEWLESEIRAKINNVFYEK